MRRRTLAFLSVLALLVGMLPAGAASVVSAETATSKETYQVGYAIKNFNPWVASDTVVPAYNEGTGTWYVPDGSDVGTVQFLEDPENTADKKIYPYLFSQSGNQIDRESIVTELHDDNGDGKVDDGDGIFATCTAVTYGKGTEDEKTVLFITTDTMKAWTRLVTAVRKKIVESDWGKQLGITADQIMVCANHTHSGPQLDGSVDYYFDTTVFDTDNKVAKLKADRKAYYDWVVDRIVAAAEESVGDQKPATMSKGAVNATEATAELNYNDGEGYHMNTIRHYERKITATKKIFTWERSASISSIYANAAIPSEQKVYDALAEKKYANASYFNPNSFGIDATYTTSWAVTDDADNMMYVLRFEFEDSTIAPVVFVNWRAHSTMNSDILNHSILSGDYATGLRQVLRDEGYRAAFFQGAAGNVVPHPKNEVYTVNGSLVKDKMDWLYEATNKASSLTLDETKKTFIYGKMLAEIAQYCMEEENASGDSYMTDTPVGEIETHRTLWKAEKNKYDKELLDAALALRAEVMRAKGWDEAQFERDYRVLFQNNEQFPYYYRPNGSTVAIINSRTHFNSVYAQAKLTTIPDETNAVELNAIMLGKNVAFITSPNELADYYHNFENDVVSHTPDEKEEHNNWKKLYDDVYGTPFVLGYSNQDSGYIASWLDHQANTQTYSTITGIADEGHMLYSPGTYEAMTSLYAAGQGELLIDVYEEMLGIVSGAYDKTAWCKECQDTKVWEPLFAENAGDTTYTTGHYYLREDFPVEYSLQRGVSDGNKVCIDLNGHTIETGYDAKTPARFFGVAEGATLTVTDSVGTGQVISHAADNNPNGGVLSVNGVVNIYGGTWSFENNSNNKYGGAGIGGVATVSGTGVLNVYGGTIEGADLVKSKYGFAHEGSGGAVYLSDSAKLNVSENAVITSGTVPEDGNGPCVFMAGSKTKVTLSGNAKVEDIFYNANNKDNVTISGKYTGTLGLSFGSAITPGQDLDIGNTVNNADISDATLSVTDATRDWFVRIDGTDLKLTGYANDTVAAVGDQQYTSLQSAVDNYTAGSLIKMIQSEENAVTVDKDVYLDLNGCSINNTVTVTGNYTLYCMDTATDDYTVSDGVYGRIKTVSGNVKGLPEESTLADDGYLKVTESGGVSFHRVNLDLTHMTLRAMVTDDDGNEVCNPSVYYKSNFKGDEKVAQYVTGYGVALSVKEMPSLENIADERGTCLMSRFTDFTAGNSLVNSGNGTLLKGIMKETNAALINNRNANIGVYGRAYIETADGYMFGAGHMRTLKQQTEDVDTMWSKLTDTHKESIETMYETYTSVMKSWTLPNLKEYMGIG